MNTPRKLWQWLTGNGQVDSKTITVEVPARSSWVLDPYHSTVKFSVIHMEISQIWGRIPILESKIQGTSPYFRDLAVEVTFDMNGLETDMPARDAHLKSADFFDVEKFPTASFRSTQVVWKPLGTFEMHGLLTLRDITKPVRLEGKMQGGLPKDLFGTPRVGFTLKGKLNRKDWGLTWQMELEGGKLVIQDIIDIEVNAELATPEGMKALKEFAGLS
ncbi:MAG: YceI family protein [Bacteroidia bacterium]